MKLAVPIICNDIIYTNADIVKPSGGVLADTNKAAESGDVFSMARIFIIGCTETLYKESGEAVTDRVSIKSLVSKMPYKTAEQLSLEILKLYHGEEDGIEGVYHCPRCGYKIISEYRESEGLEIDTRDHLRDFVTGYYEGNGVIPIDLTRPVVLKNTLNNEILENIERFTMRFPTIEDGIAAFQRVGMRDDLRLQYAMYAQALLTVNDRPVDQRWKANLGLTFFEGIRELKTDLGKLASFIKQYGIQTDAKKICPDCGKEFRVQVNTSNFFASALRPV